MDSDMAMDHLEHRTNDDDDNGDEYDSGDDDAVHALLTQTRERRKELASRAVITLWNQIGGIIIEVCIAASSYRSIF